MANNLSSFDFESNRKRINEFLKDQNNLSEYDIDGTFFDTIISVLADVTEKNAISANALFAESFLQSATQRENIIARAHELGYTPFSRNAARATIDLTVTTNDPNPPNQLILSKGSVFSGKSDNDNLGFVTSENYYANLESNQYVFKSIELIQGQYVSTDIIVDSNNRSGTYQIPYDSIDTNYLEVYVQKNLDSLDFELWAEAKSVIRADSKSKIYFIRESSAGKYAIRFGDGVIGKKVKNKSIIRIAAIKTDGLTGNNISNFNFKYDPNEYALLNSKSYTTNTTIIEKSAGGFENESNSSIRNNAPNAFISQNRAVIDSDYASIIKQEFPFINSVTVWSGVNGTDEFDQLGRIYISAYSKNSRILTTAQKNKISDDLHNKYGIGAITPVLVDASITNIDMKTTLYLRDTTFNITDIEQEVNKAIRQFNENYLNNFDGHFDHSVFVSTIDNVSDQISSNITEIQLRKDIYPTYRTNTSFTFTFHNTITSVHSNMFYESEDLKAVFFRSDNNGDIHLYETINEKDTVVKTNIGSINAETGLVVINSVNIYKPNDETGNIRFYATPKINNLRPLKNNVLVIGDLNTKIFRG